MSFKISNSGHKRLKDKDYFYQPFYYVRSTYTKVIDKVCGCVKNNNTTIKLIDKISKL